MKAKQTTIQSMLGGADQQFVVPLFQRLYSWKRREWKMLWEDIEELYTADGSPVHFFGSVVTATFEPTPAGVSKYLLIDGQQRFTTLVVLLWGVRNLAIERGTPKLAQQIEEAYLFNKFADNDLDRFKLLPTQLDRPAYQGLLSDDRRNVQGRIDDAYRFFRSRLDDTDPDGNPWDLQRLFQIIIQRLEIVSIDLDNDDDPQLIFESLNFKGAPLSQADLVRNYYFFRIPSAQRQQEIYDQLWRPMEERLGESLAEFIRQYLCKDGSFVSKGNVYQALQKRLARQGESAVIDSLRKLNDCSEHYRRLIVPQSESEPRLAKRFARLNEWQVGVVRPLLMKLYEWVAEGHVEAAQLEKCCQLIESYVVRRTFLGYKTNPLNRYFIALSGSIEPSDPATFIGKYLSEHAWPTNAQFRVGFCQFPLYESGQERVRLVLESLEEKHGHKEPVDVSNLTIEHIMPQSPNASWKGMLGENWQRDHAELLHTVGNLTLTGYNSPLGNRPFEEKRKFFEQSHLEINKWVSQQERWTRTEIEARATILFEKAVETWPGPEPWLAQE